MSYSAEKSYPLHVEIGVGGVALSLSRIAE